MEIINFSLWAMVFISALWGHLGIIEAWKLTRYNRKQTEYLKQTYQDPGEEFEHENEIWQLAVLTAATPYFGAAIFWLLLIQAVN